MTQDMTTAAFGLKEWYKKPRMIDLTHVDATFFALVKKVEQFEGSGMPISFLHTNSQGGGATFAQAQAASIAANTQAAGLRPIITPVNDYQVAVIAGALIRRAKTDMGAFMKGATLETDSAISALKSSINRKCFGDGYGALGTVGSSTGSTITLASIPDAVNFAVGLQISVALTSAYGTPRTITGTQQVTKVDTSTGIITFNQAVSNIASLTNGDSIFRLSDGSSGRINISGLEAWNPQTTPAGSESFFGVDRSVYPSRMAGQRKDMTGQPLEEVMIQVGTLPGNEGGRVDHVFSNYVRWGQMQNAMQARGHLPLDMVKVTPRIGYPALNIVGPGGPIKYLADSNCPNNRIFGVKLSALELFSSGPAVQVLDEDGLYMTRLATSDAYEVRYIFEGNLVNSEPRSSINVKV